jgi:Ca-activated chloride channel family protein
MQAVRSLKASGSTNGEAGLRTAYEIAEKHLVKGGVNRIVMASDGDLNVGMTSESDLHDFVAKKRESGVYLSVLGFGAGNYKDTKMETLADHGNGSYHYIDSESEAKRVFGERLTANLVPFANDVKVQVEFNPAKVKGYRLIGYENRTMAAEDFKDDKKDAGEVGPESQFSVLYEVVPVDSPMEVPTPELKYSQQSQEQREGAGEEWLTAKLRYKPLGKDESKEQSLTVSTGDWTNSPNDDWKFAAAVTEFGMLLRDSAYKGTATYDTVRELVGKTEDAARVEFLDLVDRAQHNA